MLTYFLVHGHHPAEFLQMSITLFLLQQSSTIVAIYNEPLGKETDGITLMFPGDLLTSSPQRVVPKRIGNRTLVFETPGKSA